MIFLTIVLPIVGNILSIMSTLSPLRMASKIYKSGKLGKYNPFPVVMTTIYRFSWLFYGIAMKNWFYICVQLTGFISSLIVVLLISGAIYNSKKLAWLVIVCMLATSFTFILTMFICAYMSTDEEGQRLVIGYMSVAFLSIFNLSPLCDIYNCLKTKDSSHFDSLYTVVFFFNSLSWALYATAIDDPLMYYLCYVSVIIFGFEILLLFIFREKSSDNVPVSTIDIA